MTRVAGANPRIWVDIFLDNRDGGRERARRAPPPHRAARARARRRATPASSRAGSARRPATAAACSTSAYDDPGALQRLRVHVPDRPGVLAGITQALGAERINIADFDLQHISPERGGTLTILVAGEQEAARAADILEARATASSSPRCSTSREGRARRALVGHFAVPGDKSISHRARAARRGRGRRDADRTASAARTTRRRRSRRCARSASTSTRTDAETLRVFGAGLRGLRPPAEPIDCGNAGTLMRLLPGLLAGQEGRFVLTGDDSLRSRPMERIAEPLRQMGARIETSDGHAPLTIEGGRCSRSPTSCRSRAHR